MIRDNVLLYSSVGLVVALAFILLPTYERFKDAEGRDTDVDPNAPAVPAGLIPIDERTGLSAVDPSFNPYEYQDFLSGKEGFDTLSGVPTPTSILPGVPTPTPTSTPTSILPGVPTPTTRPILPGVPTPTTVDSNVPSGVKVLPSQSMPPNAQVGTINKNVGLDQKVLNRTIAPPKVYEPGPQGIQGEDKYVLKSSLVPCVSGNCGSKVPGGNDGNFTPGGGSGMFGPGGTEQDDAIKKPFSQAFSSENEPTGYLNSFNAFMK
jgi:hypothetical protein